MEKTQSVVKNKVSKNIGILQKNKNVFRKDGFKTLCFFVHKYLNYGNTALGTTTRKKQKKIASKQRQLQGKNGRNL